MALKQEHRMLQLSTPLGTDELLLTAFQGGEELSRLFRFDLELLSDNNGIKNSDIVGQNVTFRVRQADDSYRPFNGFVSRFVAGDEDREGRRAYRAMVVPWLWFLTRTSDCRIFQNKTVPQILEQIFGDLGFSDYELRLSGNHPQREYCVQYRETDFAFVSRLMEEEGIYYFFRHNQDNHKMVLSDSTSAYEDCAENEVDYPSDFGNVAFEDHITSWEHGYEFRSGKWAQTDYNFTTPSTSLMTNSPSKLDLPGIDQYEHYDYPGGYRQNGDGSPLTDIRMEEEEVEYDIVQATSKCKSFTPAGKFKIRQHRCSSEQGQTFVITSLQHSAQEAQAYETGEAVERDYENSLTCIPDSVTFRPARTTPRPSIHGVHTAVVTGPAGEEIYPDEFGRVKAQFHWDREGQFDENSSCWIRVSQVHAGKGFGAIDLPRIGEEVMVAFEEGDPDRPIIAGRLYHAENMPPFGLPDNKTTSGLKSKTHQGEGYNEIALDDTQGAEELRIHGQYDMNTTVENDQTTTVHNNRTDLVDVDDSETVGAKQTISIGSDQSTTVGNDQTLNVSANRTMDVGADQTTTIGSNRSGSIGANDELTVGGAQNIGVSGAIEISSDTSITLTVGGSTLKIEPASVSIASPTITIEGSAKVEVKGAVITSQASGINEITGATVKLN